VITITGISDHLRLEWPITITGMRMQEKGGKRRVSRTHRQGKEMWCYARDEGGPLEAGSQVQASNRCKLQPSRAAVVSVAGKPERDFGRYDPERRAQANRR